MAEHKPLEGIKVIDAATLFAGPLAATILGDFGAEVLKVEHPKGDPSRSHGYTNDGIGLWWKMLGRNKRAVTLSMSTPQGAEIFKQLARDADVVIESFRPGTFERWGLGYEELRRRTPASCSPASPASGSSARTATAPASDHRRVHEWLRPRHGQPDGRRRSRRSGWRTDRRPSDGLRYLMALRARDATGRGQLWTWRSSNPSSPSWVRSR